MDIGTLFAMLFIGGIIGLLLIIAIFALIPLAAFVYIWRHVYPWVERIALWAARGENFFPLAILAVLLLILLIVGASLVSPLLLLLLPVPLVLFIPLGLGIVVWVIRLISLVFAMWRIWLVVGYLRLRVRLARAPAKISSTAARRVSPVVSRDYNKISRRKIGMSWKDKLIMKMMTNRLVIKIFSIPIVVRALTRTTQIVIWVTSRFKR